MRRSGIEIGTATILVLLGASSGAAFAQGVSSETPAAGPAGFAGDAAIPAGPPADSRVFQPDYFAQFAPRNALDMLRRIPGFEVRGDSEGRGLGQASTNVLVNSKRLSGKSESTSAQVSRISAGDVIRIELVDGATLKIPGLTGQVANLIVDVSNVSGQFEWSGEVRPLTNANYFGRAEASVSGATGNLEYTASIAHRGFRGGADGLIRVTDGAGQPIELQDFSNRANRDSPKMTGSLKWTRGELAGNLNASYQSGKSTQRSRELTGGVATLDRDRIRTFENSDPEYELGGDIEFGAGPGRLKLVALQRGDKDDFVDTVNESYFGADEPSGSRFSANSEEIERIARAEFNWAWGVADWQISGEAAFNRLDRVAALFELGTAGDFSEIEFADNTAGVTEDRYNGAISYGRPLAKNLTLQLIAGAEYSTLKQSGQSDVERSFWRPKGSANLAWAAKKGLDVSFQVERAVGQLGFGSFLASVQVNDDIADAGNSDLVPEQSWNTDLEIKKAVGKWGSATLRLFDRQISDLVEIIPIAGGGQSPGNIDSAWRHGVEFDTTIELGPLGMKGARVDLSIEFQESSVADPLDGVQRPLSNIQHRELFLGYRHDIPKSSWAYGGDLYHSKRGPGYRLTEFAQENEGPLFASLFVEHKNIFGMKVNINASNLLNADLDYRRVVFAGLRDTSSIAFTEKGGLKFGRIVRFSVSGSF
ncbi:TonB-dependent receptor plug domain-containing protein [Altererythrobacter aquiaggeris]|uniref:TonB-dependent receptor plug domain-containing protein n=1 Tax=Aestuarierythrobacter aquiaggeris TaxID=1898396 RepID=UPI003018266E